MNFTQALAHLNRLGESRMSLGLATMERALAPLGGANLPFPSVIVGGTNGKGSTTGFIDSILTHHGLRTGLFTSPHLESPRERIRISGQNLSEESFAASASSVARICEETGVSPTYFEFMTLMARHRFVEEAVDCGIFEVGLGGRLDSTNAMAHDAAVLTRIDLDHTEILGSTRAIIAADKTRIFRSNRPAISCAQAPDALAVVRSYASEIGADLHLEGEQFRAWMENDLFSYEDERIALSNVRLGILGDHQRANAALAVRWASVSGLSIPTSAILEGLTHARVPGRMERWVHPDHPEVWIDIAHNPHAATSVANHLAGSRQGPFTLVVGMLADKNWKETLSVLSPIVETAIYTLPPSPRAWKPESILDWDSSATWIEDPRRALDRAFAIGKPILAVGSFYLIGVLRPYVQERGYRLFDPANGPSKI